MRVEEWMTKNVIAISPATSIMKAARIMKENNIRRLPVVDAGGQVTGIVSDRDIKEASPSKATTLDMYELYHLLADMKVADIMSRPPICALRDDSVEGVAAVMIEKNFGGMPVVNGEGKLIGIITESDIFRLLVSITGVHSGGMQLAFRLPMGKGALRAVLDALSEREGRTVSLLTSVDEETQTRMVYIRLRPMPDEQEEKIVAEMKAAFPSMLYHVPGLGRRKF
ncbi:MAG: CBS and ACT domain-containing protein [Desulfovibrio sp.]|jgi:acetoin utilization protein AcuB|nr:CBS and ACT domain-containing protein [Desulfovibrio sp.]